MRRKQPDRCAARIWNILLHNHCASRFTRSNPISKNFGFTNNRFPISDSNPWLWRDSNPQSNIWRHGSDYLLRDRIRLLGHGRGGEDADHVRYVFDFCNNRGGLLPLWSINHQSVSNYSHKRNTNGHGDSIKCNLWSVDRRDQRC